MGAELLPKRFVIRDHRHLMQRQHNSRSMTA